jgi:hypothetical protein
VTEQGAGSPAPVADSQPQGSRRRLLRAARVHRERWADERELCHAILGTVVGAAAMVAASSHGTLGETVVSVLVTVGVYWAADCYAQLLARGVAQAPHRRTEVLSVLRQRWPMVEAAYSPLAVLIVVALVSGSLRGGVFAALGVATVMLGGLGHAAARRAGSSRAGSIGWGLVSAAFGVVVIVLKLLLH